MFAWYSFVIGDGVLIWSKTRIMYYKFTIEIALVVGNILL